MTTKLVKDLVPGNQLIVTATKTIANFARDTAQVTVTFSDGTTQSWPLDGDPAVEVIAAPSAP